MDPIQVKMGEWIWLENGPYFGIPIGNFIGWFLVTIIVTGIFRSFEFFRPMEYKDDKTIFIIPVIGYGVLALSFAISAIKYQIHNLAIYGILFMMPIVLFNLILFKKWYQKRGYQ
jgi:uncharacterized membrane protein